MFCQSALGKSQKRIEQTSSNSQTLERLQSFKASYNSVTTIGFGGAVGGASAVGAWAVVSMAGSASTGVIHRNSLVQ